MSKLTRSDKKSYQYNIILLLVLMMTISTFLPVEVYSPSLPAIANSFSVIPTLSKLTVIIFLLGSVSTLLLYGPLSDRFGRKPVLLYGLGIFLLGSYLAFVTNHFSIFLLGRFIQGAGISVCAILARTLLRDVVSGVEMAKALSMITAGVASASILSPLVGSYILHGWGYKAIFLFMLVYGFILFLVICFFYKQPEADTIEKRNLLKCFSDLIVVAKNTTFLFNVLISSISLSLLYMYYTYNPFILQVEYHNSIMLYGLIASLIFSGEILGAFINVRLLRILPISKVTLIAILTMLLVSACTYVVLIALNYKSIYLLMMSLFIINAMGGIIMPNTSALAFADFNEKKGAAGSAYSFLQTGFSFVILSVLNLFFTEPKFIYLIFIVLILSIIAFGVYFIDVFFKNNYKIKCKRQDKYLYQNEIK